MARIVAIDHVTLDGVMQGPGKLDEDTRDGFDRGGWAAGNDPELQRISSERMGSTWSLLAGRVTYQHFAKVWPNAPKPNPFTDALNRVEKFVASTTLAEPLPWENSTLLKGDVPEAVTALKERLGGNLVIFGSAVLVQSLMRHCLIDEFVLQIHPIVLGKGRRLFDNGVPDTTLNLVETKQAGSGVVIAIYQQEAKA
jgi:dihydrofolate reductase